MRTGWLVAVVVGFGCWGDDADGSVLTEDSLAAIVLQLEDLAGEFSVFDEGPQAIADAPSGDRGDPRRFGRREGWKARYRRVDTAAIDGPLVVESRVDLFQDDNGAQQEFDAHRSELQSQLGGQFGDEVVVVDGLGDEAVLASHDAGDAPAAVASYTVVWRDRNVTASVVINGFGEGIEAGDAIGLARIQQRRIELAMQG